MLIPILLVLPFLSPELLFAEYNDILLICLFVYIVIPECSINDNFDFWEIIFQNLFVKGLSVLQINSLNRRLKEIAGFNEA